MNVSPRNSIFSFPLLDVVGDEHRESRRRPLGAEGALEVGVLHERHRRVGVAHDGAVLRDALEHRLDVGGSGDLGRVAAAVTAPRGDHARRDQRDRDHPGDAEGGEDTVAGEHRGCWPFAVGAGGTRAARILLAFPTASV